MRTESTLEHIAEKAVVATRCQVIRTELGAFTWRLAVLVEKLKDIDAPMAHELFHEVDGLNSYIRDLPTLSSLVPNRDAEIIKD